MGIDNVRYHGWEGELRTPWVACAAIIRVAMLQVFRRKSYWVVIGLGLLNFLLFWSIIYAVTQFDIPRDDQDKLLGAFGFSSEASGGQENGYIMFMQRQSIIVMILLAFSGSLLVGADFRFNSLPFYLSRRIDRRHYIVGKLLAVGTLVSLLTTVPALLLFLEYGMFTSSLDYWRDNWQTPVAVIAYGLVMSTVLSVLLVTLSAYLQKMAPIAITWSSLFVMLSTMSGQLSRRAADRNWHLLDPWRDIRYVGKLCFYAGKRLAGEVSQGANAYYGIFANDDEFRRSLWALLILVSVCTVAIVALVRRVRAVEIVN
ncbi:MAG: hypothetical protein JNG90_18795 [Planctomycetaceae bacterium]|nr:hypothetical protein [Planctomycetaceae bacterium]